MKGDDYAYMSSLRRLCSIRGLFLSDLVTPDFTKMYESDEIKNLIKESEKELDSKFHHFRIAVYDYEVMVYAVFENWGYIIDFDNMKLLD